MSEQAIKAFQQLQEKGLLTAEQDYAPFLAGFKAARDALHAEAEALRAENGRLRDKYDRDVYGLNNEGDPIGGDPAGGYANDNARLRTELEAARGLLGQRIPCDVMLPPASRIKRGCTLRTVLASIKLREDFAPNKRVFTSAPAPEVQAEQGERQEAVVYAVHAKGAQVDHHCPLVSPDMAADYLPGCATPLYTSPQPGPDVRSLVEALEWYEQQAAGCRKLTSEGDECRQALYSDGGKRAQIAIAAHRQAQPQ